MTDMEVKVLDEIDKQIRASQEEEEEDINEILLDEIEFGEFTEAIRKKLESIPSLQSLALNNCGLSSLENFPNLPELVRLEVMDNKLGDDAIKVIAGMTKLQALSLCGNEITGIEKLEPLKVLDLIQLDLEGNDKLTEDQQYREKVFNMFSHLDILDNCDKEGNEILDDELDDEELDGEEQSFDEDDDEEEDFDEDDDEEEDDEDANDEGLTKKPKV